MREYGQVQCAIWGHPDFQSFSERGKVFALYLLTGPHSNGLGCYRLPLGYVAADLGWGLETVSETVSETVEAGFIKRCESTDFVLIPNYLRWNQIANGNVAKARVREYREIPSKFSYFQELATSMLEHSKHWEKGFRNHLETVSQTVTETRPDPTRPNPSPSLRSGDAAHEARPETTEGPSNVARFARTQEPEPDPPDKPEKPPRRRTNVSVEHMLETLPGLTQAVAEDYLVHRKSKRAPLTETAWKTICRNIARAQAPPDDALGMAMSRGWQGFEPDWYANAQRQAGGGHETRQRDPNAPRISAAERSVRAIAELRRREGRA